jgi:hypothetical protein
MNRNGKKWSGTKKNERERKKMALDQEKMTCTGNCQGRDEVSSPVNKSH